MLDYLGWRVCFAAVGLAFGGKEVLVQFGVVQFFLDFLPFRRVKEYGSCATVLSEEKGPMRLSRTGDTVAAESEGVVSYLRSFGEG